MDLHGSQRGSISQIVAAPGVEGHDTDMGYQTADKEVDIELYAMTPVLSVAGDYALAD